MREFQLIEGEGVAGPFREVAAQTTALLSCYAFVFEDQLKKRAGMYHYPAKSLRDASVHRTIIQMFNDIRPKIVHVVPGGTFGEMEVSGKSGERAGHIAPMFRGTSPPTETHRERAADPLRIEKMRPMNEATLSMTCGESLEDYDAVKKFLENLCEKHRAILKIYPAALIAWYRADGGGVDVNNRDMTVNNAGRDGIANLSASIKSESRAVGGRRGEGSINYYGGKL